MNGLGVISYVFMFMCIAHPICLCVAMIGELGDAWWRRVGSEYEGIFKTIFGLIYM